MQSEEMVRKFIQLMQELYPDYSPSFEEAQEHAHALEAFVDILIKSDEAAQPMRAS